LGTPADNIHDMVQKGRGSRGEKHAAAIRHTIRYGADSNFARLDESAVRAIRAAYTGKRGDFAAIARQFGVKGSQIARIVRRERWAHID